MAAHRRASPARARLVTQAVPTADAAHDINLVPLESAARVDSAVELDSGPSGSVAIREDRPGLIRVQTSSPGRQLLVVSERWHSGWTATINGRPAPVLRVNGDFLGCVVGPGPADVRLEFRPASLSNGLRLTACGLGLLVVGLLASFVPVSGRQ